MLFLVRKGIASEYFNLWVKDPSLESFILQLSQVSHLRDQALISLPTSFSAEMQSLKLQTLDSPLE